MRIKVCGRRFIFRIWWSENRRIRWLPAVMVAYIGKLKGPKEPTAIKAVEEGK